MTSLPQIARQLRDYYDVRSLPAALGSAHGIFSYLAHARSREAQDAITGGIYARIYAARGTWVRVLIKSVRSYSVEGSSGWHERLAVASGAYSVIYG